ncbi:MerR family transcriptional regulator [Parafrankia soli]|uniref:MerR family transcriptional regulator n=1 Tax=Parafrankia soli TaxID=2599596 RepID=A0A1S1RBX5_9ACTN|nr:MerR family transcriptional regulator [Parafrankia soli]
MIWPVSQGSHTTRQSTAVLLQIGEVAERVQLSLRTVRYYEEAGLLTPAGRTDGGFRLYDDNATDRLLLIKKMKPLGFTLDEIRELLTLRDDVRCPGLTESQQEELRKAMRTWSARAEEKAAALRGQIRVAESFVHWLHEQVDDPRTR